jgi:hypothetical protein
MGGAQLGEANAIAFLRPRLELRNMAGAVSVDKAGNSQGRPLAGLFGLRASPNRMRAKASSAASLACSAVIAP